MARNSRLIFSPRIQALSDSREEVPLRTPQCIVFILLFAIRVLCQNPVQVADDAIFEPVSSSSQPTPLPEAPRTPRVIDKKFLFVMAGLAASETLRTTSNTMALDREYKEGAPWVTSAPNPWKLSAKNGAIFAAELIVAYEVKKPHDWLPGDKVIRKLWWGYPVAMSTIHFKKAAHTIGMSAPAGCTPEQCELP